MTSEQLKHAIDCWDFIKTDDFKDGLSSGVDGIYSRDFGQDFRVQLIVSGNMVTLSYIDNPNSDNPFKRDVACRYVVNTQEQFDFIILNGRVGDRFKRNPAYESLYHKIGMAVASSAENITAKNEREVIDSVYKEVAKYLSERLRK